MKLTDILVKNIHQVTQTDMEIFLTQTDNTHFRSVDIDTFDRAVKKLKQWAGKPKILVFRGMSVVGDPIDHLLKRKNLGTSWTYDDASAKAYRDKNRGFGDEFIIASEVTQNHVSWMETVACNMVPVRCDYENEIRLKQNMPIKLVEIFDEKMKTAIPLDDGRGLIFKKRFKT